MTAGLTGRGRPLRFLALFALGWVGLRIGLIWSATGSLPAALESVNPFAGAPSAAATLPPAASVGAPVAAVRAAPVSTAKAVSPVPMRAPAPDPMGVRMAMLNLLQFGPVEYVDSPPQSAPLGGPAPSPTQQRLGPVADRWSASAWLVARPGEGIGAAPGGQLGGSQAGVRIAWMADPERRIALYGRVTAPLSGKGREAALGVEWQPTRLPVRIAAEERIPLDSGRAAPGIGVIAGVDHALGAGFRLESYGQAGAVARARIEPYADGAARMTHMLVERDRLRMAVGAGAWGAIQRGAARLDIGPSATLALPVARQQFRLALDWRQRIAGDARPGSGLAFTVGADF